VGGAPVEGGGVVAEALGGRPGQGDADDVPAGHAPGTRDRVEHYALAGAGLPFQSGDPLRAGEHLDRATLLRRERIADAFSGLVDRRADRSRRQGAGRGVPQFGNVTGDRQLHPAERACGPAAVLERDEVTGSGEGVEPPDHLVGVKLTGALLQGGRPELALAERRVLMREGTFNPAAPIRTVRVGGRRGVPGRDRWLLLLVGGVPPRRNAVTSFGLGRARSRTHAAPSPFGNLSGRTRGLRPRGPRAFERSDFRLKPTQCVDDLLHDPDTGNSSSDRSGDHVQLVSSSCRYRRGRSCGGFAVR
jgi:hypothetical protein